MLPLKVYVFSEQGDQTTMKINDPGDQAFTSVTVSSKFCLQNSFKAAGWDGPTSQTTPVGTSFLSQFSQGSAKDTSAHRWQEIV